MTRRAAAGIASTSVRTELYREEWADCSVCNRVSRCAAARRRVFPLVPPTALVEEALENAIETQVEGAQLPIEEKLKKLVKLQSMAYAVGRDRGRMHANRGASRSRLGSKKPINNSLFRSGDAS